MILSGQFEDLLSELLGAFTHQSSPMRLGSASLPCYRLLLILNSAWGGAGAQYRWQERLQLAINQSMIVLRQPTDKASKLTPVMRRLIRSGRRDVGWK